MKMSKKQKQHFRAQIALIRTVNNGSEKEILQAFGVDKKTAINNLLAAMERDIES